MEDYGKLRSRYYVIKTSGIFAKTGRILEIFTNGFAFLPLNNSKDREFIHFKEGFEITLAERNDKDFQLKSGKYIFTITSNERIKLLTDIFYYKDIWDLTKEDSQDNKKYEGLQQLELADLSSKTQISMRLLRSAILISYPTTESEKAANLVVRYIDIEAVMVIPTGFLIDKKLEYVKLIFDNDSVQEIAEGIKTIPQKNLGVNVSIKAEYSYLEKKIVDIEEYSVSALTKVANSVKKIRIHVDTNSIVEENVIDNKILRVKDVSSLFGIKVKRGNDTQLKLYFQNGEIFKYTLQPNTLNYLLANIMSSILSKEDSIMPVIVREKSMFQVRIRGIGGDVDGVHESYLSKTIHDACIVEDLSANNLDSLILDASLNTNIKIQMYDSKLVQALFELASSYAKELKILETDEQCLLDYKECLTYSSLGKYNGKNLLNLYRKLPPLLSLLRLYLVSRSTSIETTTFQKELETLLTLAGSKESIISFLASLTLRALVKVNKAVERRLETAEKKWIIKEFNVISQIFELLFKFMEKSPTDFFNKFFFNVIINDCPYLEIYGLLSIFEVILLEKREGTPIEDVAYVSDSIINGHRVMNALEQFIMYNSKPIIYQTSLITAQSLLLIFNSKDKTKFALMQPKLVENTMLLLWHIQLLFAPSSIRQKNLSASVAALTLFHNIENCSLIARVFPRSMLRKVDAEKWYTDWEPAHWKEFFALLQNNYNTITEQWNEDCRNELVTKIRDTVINYLQAKYKNGIVKWNYEEFEVIYSCLEHKCLVGNYYLEELILFDESNNPYLKEPIGDPKGFWNKLIIAYFEETQREQQKIILTTMMLIYREYSELIGQCEMMPYFIHLLEKVEEKDLHLYIVKFILSTVKAERPDTFKENYRIILKANGIRILLNMICKIYGSKEDKEQKAQICCCIIKILGCVLKRKEKPKSFPESNVRILCKERQCISAIVQLLLIKNTELRKLTIKLLSHRFTSNGLLLKETGIIDLLINCIDESTGSEALQLLFQLQNNIKDFNNDIEMSEFLVADQEIIKENPKIRESIFLRFLPICFVCHIVNEPYNKDILAIFLSEEYSKPTLIWSKNERLILTQSLKSHLKSLKNKLKEKSTQTIKDLPLYDTHFNNIIKYPDIEKEIRCGGYFVRAWIKANGPLDTETHNQFFFSLNNTLRLIVNVQGNEKLNELMIVLKAFDIYLKKFTPIFECYPELLRVINRIISLKFSTETKKYLKKLLKFIYKTIAIEDNFKKLEDVGGIHKIICLINSWIDFFKVEKYDNCTYEDFDGIKWAIAILCEASNLIIRTDHQKTTEILRNLIELTYHQHKLVYEFKLPKIKLNTSKQKKYLLKNTLKTPLYEKDKTLTYGLIRDLISKHNDLNTISILLQVMELTFTFIGRLSQNSEMQELLAFTGWSWAGLYYGIYCDTANYDYLKNYFEVSQLEIIPLMILKHACIFSLNLKSDSEVLELLEATLKKLMGNYLFDLIVLTPKISGNTIMYKSYTEVTANLKKVLDKLNANVDIPKFVWNIETRKELRNTLENHLMNIFKCSGINTGNFLGNLKDFKYKSYQNEIIVGSVFIRVINTNPLVPLNDVTTFFNSVFQELETINKEPLRSDNTMLHKASDIIKALENIIIYQKTVELPEFSPNQLNTLIQFLIPPKITLDNSHLESIITHTLGVFVEISRDFKSLNLLLANEDFMFFGLYHLCNVLISPVASVILAIVHNMFNQSDSLNILIEYGYMIPLFRVLLDSDADKKCRGKAMSPLIKLLVQDKSKKEIVGNYVPHPVLQRLAASWSKKIDEIFNFIDNDYIDPYITWNKVLRVKVSDQLQKETHRIMQSIEEGCKIKWINMDKEDPMIFSKQRELVIDGVIIINYIKVPYSKLNKSLDSFICGLNEEIVIDLLLLNRCQSGATIEKSTFTLSEDKMKKHFKNFQNSILCMVTGLLMAYEQAFRNVHNPSKSSNPTQNIQYTKNLRKIICAGLRSSNNLELNIMLLEILILISEQKQILGNDELQVVTVSVIQCFYDEVNSEFLELHKVQEIMSLIVLIKVVERIGIVEDKETLIDIITTKDFINKLLTMYQTKPHLTKYTAYLLTCICQSPIYYKLIINEQTPDIMKIVEEKQIDILKDLWRKEPNSPEEYEIYNVQKYLEECDSRNVENLPLISKRIFEVENYEESKEVFLSLYGSDLALKGSESHSNSIEKKS